MLPRGLAVGVAAKALDGTWRVKLYAGNTDTDVVRVLLFDDFSQLLKPDSINAPPLAGMATAPQPAPDLVAKIQAVHPEHPAAPPPAPAQPAPVPTPATRPATAPAATATDTTTTAAPKKSDAAAKKKAKDTSDGKAGDATATTDQPAAPKAAAHKATAKKKPAVKADAIPRKPVPYTAIPQ